MNNNFYILRYSDDPKIIGKAYPQAQKMSGDYNFSAQNSCWKISYDAFPDFEPNFKSFVLHRSAKLTDVISNSVLYFGLLISERFSSLLNQFSIPTYRLFTAYLIQNANDYQYKFFHHVSDFTTSIDFEKTDFYLFDGFERTAAEISSHEQLRELYMKLPTTTKIKTDKYYLKDSNPLHYDIFSLSFTNSNTYISHRLKTALEEAHITGIDIIPTDVI